MKPCQCHLTWTMVWQRSGSAQLPPPPHPTPDRGMQGGGGHCLFKGRYRLPSRCPRLSALSIPQIFLTVPYFAGSCVVATQNQTFLRIDNSRHSVNHVLWYISRTTIATALTYQMKGHILLYVLVPMGV